MLFSNSLKDCHSRNSTIPPLFDMHQRIFLIRSVSIEGSLAWFLPPTLSTFSCCRKNQTNVKEPPARPSADYFENVHTTVDHCFSVDRTTLDKARLQMPNCSGAYDNDLAFGRASQWIVSLLSQWNPLILTLRDIFSTSSWAH